MIHRSLIAVALIAVVLATSTFAADQRLRPNPPAGSDAPPVFQVRSGAQAPAQTGPTEPFGRINRGGADRAAAEFSKAYKKTINKSQITGPIELTLEHLGEGADRFLDLHHPMSVVPGAAKFGARSGTLGSSTPVAVLRFKPFKPNVPHMFLFHVGQVHSGPQKFVVEGGGITYNQTLKGGGDHQIGVVVVPPDTTPLTLNVRATSSYYWRFYGVEVSMLNP